MNMNGVPAQSVSTSGGAYVQFSQEQMPLSPQGYNMVGYPTAVPVNGMVWNKIDIIVCFFLLLMFIKAT